MTCSLEPRTLFYPESASSEHPVSILSCPLTLPLLFLTCSLGTGNCGEMGLDLV